MPLTSLIRAIDPGAPIVVGGGGGSGTRVIAAILLRLGFHLGTDRNSAEDNLLFTLLFKRPRWLARAGSSEVEKTLGTLERGLVRGCPLQDLPVLVRAVTENILRGRDYGLPRRALWSLRRLSAAMRTPRLDGQATGWGWKEPNSHVFIDHLARRYPRMRYIHVIRHGLDMAYSGNQAQLRNWGPLYGVELDASAPAAHQALQFWIRSNQAAIRKAEHLFGDRFLLVRFDDVCDQPRGEIQRLAAFLGVSLCAEDVEALSALPRSPSSRGRYRGHHLADFDPVSIAAVEAMGFEVEGASREAAA